MTDQKVARKISSFAAPTKEDLAYFESLPPAEQRALLQAELEKGYTGEPSGRSIADLLAAARARVAGRHRTDG